MDQYNSIENPRIDLYVSDNLITKTALQTGRERWIAQ